MKLATTTVASITATPVFPFSTPSTTMITTKDISIKQEHFTHFISKLITEKCNTNGKILSYRQGTKKSLVVIL